MRALVKSKLETPREFLFKSLIDLLNPSIGPLDKRLSFCVNCYYDKGINYILKIFLK